MLRADVEKVSAIVTRLSAAADLESDVTLSPEESLLLVRYIMNEKYRTR